MQGRGPGIHQRQAGDQGAEQQGVAGENVAVADAFDQRLGQGLHRHGGQGQGNQAHAGLSRGIAHRQLQQQRREKGQRSAAQAGEEVADDAHGEAAGVEQRGGEQGLFDTPGA